MKTIRTGVRALLSSLLLAVALPVAGGTAGSGREAEVERILARYDGFRFPETVRKLHGLPVKAYDLALVDSGDGIVLQLTDRATRRGVRVPAIAVAELAGDAGWSRGSRIWIRTSDGTGSLVFSGGDVTASFPLRRMPGI